MDNHVSNTPRDGNILLLLLDIMKKVDREPILGKQKKELVKIEIRNVLGIVVYDRYEYILDLIIDLLVGISKKDINLGLNNVKKCFC